MPTADPLQRYRVMESLGSGGQGNTFRGVDLDTNRDVAIKVISLKKLREWKAFDLFEREIDVLRGMSHPGIPKYIDHFAVEASGDYFLVMELVEGAPLGDFVAGDRRLEGKRIPGVFEQALDILEYLHSLAPPVIHRDIKPANMVLQSDGTLRLVDFGGVRRKAKGDGGSTVVGTFGYMAPEQLHGQADQGADIYALGATMVALLTGEDAGDLPREGLRIDLDALDLPARWRDVLGRMLAPEPRERLRSVEAVRKVWRRSHGGTADGTAAPPRAPRVRPTPGAEPAAGQLVRIPDGAKELAKVRAPFSVFVWIAVSLGSGGLLVFEALMLPIVYRLWSTFFKEGEGPEAQDRVDRGFGEFRGRVKRARETLAYVASETRPSAD
jgi:serine/threonine protein kinase